MYSLWRKDTKEKKKMIHYVTGGDLLTSNCNFICHQVNCQGKMGSGVAKQIRDRWPEVYINYQFKCDQAWAAEREDPMSTISDFLLGDIQIVQLEKPNVIAGQSVINMFAQEFYGYSGARYTSYDAFWNCLHLIKNKIPNKSTIAFPYNIGCGLGGANWEVIVTMIDVVLKDYDVYIYRLNPWYEDLGPKEVKK